MKCKTFANFFLPKAFLCLCLLSFQPQLHAQLKKKIDSLKLIIANAANDKVKLNALENLNELNPDRQELTDGFKQQVALAIKLKEYLAAANGYSQLGYFEYEKNNLVAAENIIMEGMKLAKQINNYYVMGRCCNSLMCIYDKKGDMKTAISYLELGEQMLIKANRMKNLTRLYCNASNTFNNHNLVFKALEYDRKAYATAEVAKSRGDMEPMTTASWYLANGLQAIGKYDSAIYYFSQGLHIAENLELPYTQGDMLRGLSDVYAELKKYPKAKQYLHQAILMYDSVHVPDRVNECEESLTYLNFMEKDFAKVKNYVLSRQKKINQDSVNNNLYIKKWMANLALVEGKVDEWKDYSKKYEQADAELTNEKIQKNLLELEAKYNLSKKESELLQKDIENRKRLWIIAALGFALLSIAVMALMQYSNHKNKNKIFEQKTIIEKQNALSEERLRIAADMHDDVGAGLSRIRYISASLKDKQHFNNDDINKIVALSDESVEKMNEIIWALNQGNQQLDELIYYTRSQCSEMVSNAGLSFVFDLPETIPSKIIGWKHCRNIYLLIKEAVNNAIKHAEATSIIIECSIAENLQFSIIDNGKGFNPDTVKTNGNGLLNYKKRIQVLNGNYQLVTSPGNGTKLLFTIPFNSI